MISCKGERQKIRTNYNKGQINKIIQVIKLSITSYSV